MDCNSAGSFSWGDARSRRSLSRRRSTMQPRQWHLEQFRLLAGHDDGASDQRAAARHLGGERLRVMQGALFVSESLAGVIFNARLGDEVKIKTVQDHTRDSRGCRCCSLITMAAFAKQQLQSNPDQPTQSADEIRRNIARICETLKRTSMRLCTYWLDECLVGRAAKNDDANDRVAMWRNGVRPQSDRAARDFAQSMETHRWHRRAAVMPPIDTASIASRVHTMVTPMRYVIALLGRRTRRAQSTMPPSSRCCAHHTRVCRSRDRRLTRSPGLTSIAADAPARTAVDRRGRPKHRLDAHRAAGDFSFDIRDQRADVGDGHGVEHSIDGAAKTLLLSVQVPSIRRHRRTAG